MAREIPEVVRAAAGLAATVLDEARRLPETLPGLPVRVIGLAMQATMKLQQQYSGLVARGDELFTGLRGADEPGMATFDEDLPAAPTGNGVHTSAFDRAAEAVPDEGPTDAEIDAEVALLVDDEVSGLPPEPAPEEVVEALQDINDQVAAADLDAAPVAGLTTEDALETALLEADGAPDAALVDGGAADGGLVDPELIAESPTTPPDAVTGDAAPTTEAPAPSDPGGSPVGEEAGSPDVGTTGDAPTVPEPAADLTADVATEVDVLTADGQIETVEATVTDEGVAAPESADEPQPPTADAAADQVLATDEGGTPVAAATGGGESGGVDVPTTDGGISTVEATVTDEGVAAPESGAGGESPTADASPAAEGAGSPDESAAGGGDAGAAPVDGYDGFTVAQLRGRLRGYQHATVRDLLDYEQATRARAPYLTMLRNRLEKLDQQAADASPLAPRGA
ncbi:hypothetical protein GCU56_08250 [Geodermatophilus sabuli]|uniref:Lipid droplet-associated protein n=1 Tax=Geodermatophilus sabuli TaxID=1564158 RepID=A0A7K3VYZ4_9ACTN|nr:hypothetical protein [Geodermatophilus sabuli]NEK57861.1 hypothetical protein [Geodermatophilus sabuli]